MKLCSLEFFFSFFYTRPFFFFTFPLSLGQFFSLWSCSFSLFRSWFFTFFIACFLRPPNSTFNPFRILFPDLFPRIFSTFEIFLRAFWACFVISCFPGIFHVRFISLVVFFYFLKIRILFALEFLPLSLSPSLVLILQRIFFSRAACFHFDELFN